ncbi:hypothetical protein KSP39_PZI021679 [Platanthera zijinensis]|uniref:Uncharacterized protein n=1 Tax=Platanthera zijinensis TaxID=2320716 RepID=A0AAP0AYE6_9ASPA
MSKVPIPLTKIERTLFLPGESLSSPPEAGRLGVSVEVPNNRILPRPQVEFAAAYEATRRINRRKARLLIILRATDHTDQSNPRLLLLFIRTLSLLESEN